MRIFLLFTGCFVFLLCSAQSRKNIYAEAFGNAPQGSVNYDQRINARTDFGLGLRAGISASYNWYHIKAVTVGVPIGVNYLLGKGHHALETGVVLVPQLVVRQPQAEEGSTSPPYKMNAVLFRSNLNIGYRLQPVKDKGFMVNALWTPAIISSKDAGKGSPWLQFGLGIGYSFR